MSGCGSSRPVPAARRQARVSNKQPGPRALSGLLEVLTPTRGRQGREGQGRSGQDRADQGRAGQVTTVLVYREALPSLTVLTGRSAGGLGRSLERPCKWSAALSAVWGLGFRVLRRFRVWGLGFRVWVLGFGV